ncbi:MAG: 2-hydroxyacid dehydrogenase [Candidatus Geothermarchaeales archaeon]
MNNRLIVALTWPASPEEASHIRGALDPGFEVVVPETRETEALSEAVEGCDVILSWSSPPMSVLDNAKRVRFIQTLLAGVDSFEFSDLKERGILLAGVSGANATGVAEHALALMLALAKNLVKAHIDLTAGTFPPYTTDAMNIDLYGKRLTIVGLGNVGIEVARTAFALGMEVTGVRKHPKSTTLEDREIEVAGTHDLRRVLSGADFVVLTVPLTEETRGLIAGEELRAMKKTAFLVNVSRGEVVDEEALYRALVEGWIAGAGLDVWYQYPPSPHTPSKIGLHRLRNVVATPHRAAWTKSAYRKSLDAAVQNLNRYIRGQELRNLVDLDLGY